MTRLLTASVFLCLLVSTASFAQTGNAQLGGIVQDPSKALVPGVTITAVNTATGVTNTQLTNESGAYSFPVLQPGTYRISAELPGFRKEVFNEVQLPYAGQIRLDITLQVGAASTSVEVSVAADSVLRQSSASVGDVLTRQQIENLPLVGNNILDLLTTLPGVRFDNDGNVSSVNGLGVNSINATRDGLSINDVRNSSEIYGTKVMSQTILLPDLVGEIRMILSPVDAELGRGNSQIQISTRSGTNRYTGAVSWNIRNSALDANTWDNNHTPFTDPFSGERFNSTPATWNNNHQYTISYGGPVKIPGLYEGRNRTFFYALWEQNIRNTRDLVSTPVLTDTARLGIFRYWSGYNPLGWNPSATLANPVYPQVATTASLIAVDSDGNPVRPIADPTSPTANPAGAGFIPYSGNLTCFSVFGTMRLDNNGNMVPFTSGDCPGGTAVTPTGRPAWDDKRPTADTTGLIHKFIALTPKATYYGGGDGLNIANVRWVRGRKGTNDAVNGIVGTVNLANNKQINLKVDHNFSSSHKVAVSWTHQIDDSADNAPGYPDGIYGKLFRRPHTLTVNGTSTITPRMVNEARFGLNYTLNQDAPPWESPDAEIQSLARDLLPPGGTSIRNPSFQYLALVNTGIGNVSTGNGYMNSGAAGNFQENWLYNWADTLSYSTGKHSLKFGVEWRLPRTSGTGASQAYPTVTLGNASAGLTNSPFATTATFNTAGDPVGFLPGLLNSAPTGVTATRSNVTNLLYYLNGSVSAVSQNYWITGGQNITQGYWDDISTQGQRIRKQISQEFALFAKDDYKITRRLTLNLGLRWEYYGSPYIQGGFTSAFVGGGWGAFGATRTAQTTLEDFNADPFKYFLHPGNLYLTGYGSSTTNPLSCQRGVQQNGNPLLPVSTCDPASLAQVEFVGPGSVNPNKTAIPQNFGNFGPAIGFAYTLPWFGEGKTTIRGGYQQTFGSAGANRSALSGGTEATLANAPGAVTSGTLAGHINDSLYQSILATSAINLSHMASLVPMAPNVTLPGEPLPVYRGLAGPGAGVPWNVYDPNLKTPYTQNLTLSVTRQVSRAFTVDVRYTGTLGRRRTGSIDINQNNVYYNPELFQALKDARAGTCTPNAPGYADNYTSKGLNPCNINNDPVLFDQMLAGLNLNVNTSGAAGTGTFGAVGTVNSAGIYQSGAQQLRRSATFQNNLSWGVFDAVADGLIALAPSRIGTANNQGGQPLPIDPNTGGTIVGVAQTGLRNGCDRIANGFTIVQQTTAGGSQVANTGSAIPLRCFPEDWLHANPQFGSTAGSSVVYNTNTGSSNYHSLQVQVTARPVQGISTQATWVWAKSFQVPGSGYIDPTNRSIDYGVQNINPHALRMNGTVELPIGPNKIFFGNASGWAARVMERWQMSFIFNAATGTPATFNPGQSHFYAVSRYDVASPKWKIPVTDVTWADGATSGTMFPGNHYLGVTDPSCFDPTVVTMGDKMGTILGRTTGATPAGPCTIFALAERNPDGTQGDILLKYPEPGKVGNLGKGNMQYFGQWSFDMSASKSFQIDETRSLQFRADAQNVLNHPNLDIPTLGASNFGAISGKGTQHRTFQAQVRVSF